MQQPRGEGGSGGGGAGKAPAFLENEFARRGGTWHRREDATNSQAEAPTQEGLRGGARSHAAISGTPHVAAD